MPDVVNIMASYKSVLFKNLKTKSIFLHFPAKSYKTELMLFREEHIATVCVYQCFFLLSEQYDLRDL